MKRIDLTASIDLRIEVVYYSHFFFSSSPCACKKEHMRRRGIVQNKQEQEGRKDKNERCWSCSLTIRRMTMIDKDTSMNRRLLTHFKHICCLRSSRNKGGYLATVDVQIVGLLILKPPELVGTISIIDKLNQYVLTTSSV